MLSDLKNRLGLRALSLAWRAGRFLAPERRRKWHRRLENCIFRASVTRQGRALQLYAPYRQRIWWQAGYESEMFAWLAANFPASGCAIDVCAQIGGVSVFLGLLAGTQGRVEAVEPLLENLRALQLNVAANRLSHIVRVHEACCAAREGGRWLSAEQDARALHFEDVPVPVPALTVDGLAMSNGRLDLLRLDVGGGAEMEVLQGAEMALRKYRPKILATLYPPMAAEATVFLSANSYRATDLQGQPLWAGDLLLRAGNQDVPPFHVVFLPESGY